MFAWGNFVWNLEDIWYMFCSYIERCVFCTEFAFGELLHLKAPNNFFNVPCSNFCNFVSDWSVNSEQDIAISQPVAFLHN